MAYVGQNNLTAGAAVGQAILNAGVKSGDLVAGIIATPGTGNIQPRIDGAKPVLTKAGVNFVEVGTSATEGAPEYNKISSWYAGHKDVKWMMAVDSGDSNAVAQFIQKNSLKGKVGASVWDVGLPVAQAINAGYVTATIDQQAYLQGFDTIMQLFLFNVSGGLMKPTEHRHGTRHRDQVERRAVPPGDQVRGNGRGEEGVDAADLDLDLAVRQRAIGRSNVCCCPGGQPAGAAARSPSTGRQAQSVGLRVLRLFLYQRELTPVVITIGLFVYFTIRAGSTFTGSLSLSSAAGYAGPIGAIAVGEVLLLVLAEIDLSVGQVFLFCPWVMYWAHNDGVPLVLAIADRARSPPRPWARSTG